MLLLQGRQRERKGGKEMEKDSNSERKIRREEGREGGRDERGREGGRERRRE